MPGYGETPVATSSAPPGFELQRMIGRGASGRVFQAKQHSTRRLVALKMLDVDPASTDAGSRFDRECTVMGELGGHPNIVTVYDAGRYEGQPWIAMELCSSGSLADRLGQRGPMAVPDAVAVLTKIAGALHTAHRRGVLHCDVKPANIMITEFGEPALGDFGIARLVGGRTRLSTIGGGYTLDHAPPEALNGDASTAAADVYSLGTTIWQLLDGRAPFSRASDSGVGAVITRILSEPLPPLSRSDVPDQLTELLAAMTAKDPVARPGDPSELAERAAAIDVGEPVVGVFGSTGGLAGVAGVAGVGVAEFATGRGGGGSSPAYVGLGELATERAPGGASAYPDVEELATRRMPSGAGGDQPTTARAQGGFPPAPTVADPGPRDLHYVGWGGPQPGNDAWAPEPGLTRARISGRQIPPGKPTGRFSGVNGWFARPPVRITAIALVVVALLAGAGVAVWWTTTSPQPAADQQGIGQVAGQPGAGLDPGQPEAPANPDPGAPGGAPAPNGAPPAPQAVGQAPPGTPPADGSDGGSDPAGTSASGTHTLAQRLGPNCDRPDYWKVTGPVSMDIAPGGAVSGTMRGSGRGNVTTTCDGVHGTINWDIAYTITFTGRISNGQLTATGTMNNVDQSKAVGCTQNGAAVNCPPNVESGPRKYPVTIGGRLDQGGAGLGAVKADMARATGGTWTVS